MQEREASAGPQMLTNHRGNEGMKRASAVVLLLAMLFVAGCSGQKSAATPSGTASTAGSDFKSKGYKVAYILNGTSTEIFRMAFNGAQKEAESLGMKLEIFTSDGDDLKFQDLVNQCAQQGYNGMFISHGKPDYSYKLIKPLVDKGIKVVTFDTVIQDSQGKGIPGVTTTFQNDQEMARLSLDFICNELFKDLGRPVRVLKLWRGPGIPPFDRRQETYKKFEEEGKIKTLEVLGPSNPADSEGSIATVIASVLPKYPKGSVDVIWSAYDAYARGAYKALTEAGRTDIPIVSIDISNQDINLMRAKDGIWKACIATHFENVGIMGMRLLAMKLHGDPTPDTYILSPSTIKASQLTPEANVTNLGTIIPGYGVSNDNLTDWMKALKGQK